MNRYTMDRYLIDHQTLYELANIPLDEKSITVGSAGDMTGVVWPFNITAGQIMSVDRAREIAAQLLLMADLHDDIQSQRITTESESNMGTVEQLNTALAKLAKECEYSDGENGEESDVESLIGYKNALENLVTELWQYREVMREIHFYLWPEQYPKKQGNKHPSWNGDGCFQWSSDTIQAVSEMVSEALENDSAIPRRK